MTDTFHVPAVGKEVKLGKLAPSNDDRNLKLGRYLDQAVLPKAPTTLALGTKVSAFPMYENDKLGDCTIAAKAHMIQTWTSNHGPYYQPTDAEVDLDYWETGTPPSAHGTAGGPTDTGRVETDVLNYWHNNGFGVKKDKIAAYAQVNVKNTTEVKQATWLFGGLYLGVALPISAQNQTYWKVVDDDGSGDTEPGSWGGHAICVTAYTPTYLTVITWGMRMKMSWGFWGKYVDESYAILTQDWVDGTGKLPSSTGFNWSQLQTDLSSIS